MAQSEYRLQSKSIVGSQPQEVPLFSLTIEVYIESTNRAYIASIKNFTKNIAIHMRECSILLQNAQMPKTNSCCTLGLYLYFKHLNETKAKC